MVIFVCADCERVGAALAPLSVQQICKNSTFFCKCKILLGKRKFSPCQAALVERQDAAGRRKARQNTSRAMKKPRNLLEVFRWFRGSFVVGGMTGWGIPVMPLDYFKMTLRVVPSLMRTRFTPLTGAEWRWPFGV